MNYQNKEQCCIKELLKIRTENEMWSISLYASNLSKDIIKSLRREKWVST